MELAAILMLGLMVLMITMSPLRLVSPSVVLAGTWAVVYVLQSVFASDMESSFLATITIFAITLSFAVGELIATRGVGLTMYAQGEKAAALPPVNDNYRNERRLRNLVLVLSVFSIAGALLYASALGMLGARSFAELIFLPGDAREQIMSGDLDVSLFSRVGFLCAYSGVVLALAYNYLYRWRWWLVLPMISVLLLGMSQSGRLGGFIVLFQWLFSAYLKNIIVLKQSAVKFILRSFFLPVIFMFVFFVSGQLLREGFSSLEIEDVVRIVFSLRAYLFGGVSSFSYWITTIYDGGMPTLGRYSFSSLFAVLGIFPQAPGVYDEYALISSLGETSNLYTAYRSFIDDFSIVGACIFYLISGFFIGAASHAFVKGKRILILILIPLLSWLAFSPLVSLSYFNSFLLSCFLPYFLVRKFLGNNI